MSSRGLAAAAPTQEVQPCSRYFLATWATQSVCSSGGITWMPSSEAALFQEKWVCASVMPGISVAPAASIDDRAAGGHHARARAAAR